MTNMNMNDEYVDLTPVETEDEMRERYARLEQETLASWSKVEQEKQAMIDQQLMAAFANVADVVDELIKNSKAYIARLQEPKL